MCLFYFILTYYIYKKETRQKIILVCFLYIYLYKRKYFLPAKLKIFFIKIKEARLNFINLIIYENNQKIII